VHGLLCAAFMKRPLALALFALVSVAAAGCAAPETDAGCGEVDRCGLPRDEVGAARGALSLESLAGSGGCSTAGAEAISAQLIEEMLCLAEGRLVRFEHRNVTLTSSRVHPYLSPAGRDALYRAADGGEVRINSALRTISDQYLLYAGCSVAATPGRSNHETGRAIDVDNWSARLSALLAAGFTHPLPDTDAVHFEASGDDLRSLSVRAFQRLWNANHADDTIAEDGVTGPQTLARLARTPAEGFAIAGVCSAMVVPPPDAGTTPIDAGSATADAGAEPIDAGMIDAGVADGVTDLGAHADASIDDGRPRASSVESGCSVVVARGASGHGAALVAMWAFVALVRRRRRTRAA